MAFGHGATTREEEILTLSDRDMPSSEIASELGVSIPYVKTVLSRMRPSPVNRAFEDMVAQGSADLLRALCRHHPDVAAAARSNRAHA